MMTLKKKMIVAAVSQAILASSASYAVVGDYTGTFTFYDAGGNIGAGPNTTVYGLASDPGTYTQPFFPSGFDFTNRTGAFTDDTLFNGFQWFADVDTMYFYDPVAGGNQTFTWTWTNRTFANADFSVIVNCRTGVTLDGCADEEADVTLSELGAPGTTNSYTFTLTAPGQYALATFFDWSSNEDIPVLSGHQITAINMGATSSITVGTSLDIGDAGTAGEGVPGTAMKTSPFPDQSPTFEGDIEIDNNQAPSITAQASSPSVDDNTAYTITTADVTVTQNTNFPANLYTPDVTIQAADGTGYTRVGNTITPTIEPTANTTLTVPVTVTDSRFGTSASFDLSIQVTPVNDAPVITGTPATAVTAGNAYSFDPAATDNDTSDTLTYSITNAPAWASFDTSTGVLSGTPSIGDAGSYTGITITVTDDDTATAGANPLTDNITFDITVTTGPNNPPDLSTSPTPPSSVDQDSLYSYTPVNTDPDLGIGDTQTYTGANIPSWLELGSATGVLSGTPTNADVGVYNDITITVTDSFGAQDSIGPFSITVNNINDAPTISGTPATLVNVGDSYSFTPAAADIDAADTLTFSITGNPAWTTFDTATGTLSGTPTDTDAGVSGSIVITVTDDSNDPPGVLSASLPGFTITVNRLPVASNGIFATDVNTDATGTVSASDPDGDTLTYTIVADSSDGVTSLNMTTGEFTFTPNTDFEGSTSFTYKVNDGNADSAEATVTILVGASTTFRFEGSNFTMLDGNGANVNGGANDVAAAWNGVTTTDIADTNFNNMTLSSNTPFFGATWTAHHIRVFGPGTYSFDTTCTTAQLEAGVSDCNNPLQAGQQEQYLTMTVDPGQIGVHMLFNWNGNDDIDVVNVYDINAEFTTAAPGALYTGGDYGPYPWSGAPAANTKWRLASTDDDGDGIAGVPMVDGAFIDFNANFNLFVGSGETVTIEPVPNEVGDTNVNTFLGALSIPSILSMMTGWWLARRATRYRKPM